MKMLNSLFIIAFTLSVTTASAVIQYDQNATNNIIFGSGNVNGFFSMERASGVEIGLRAKLRFDGSNQPQNFFGSDGQGLYFQPQGIPMPGFGFAPNDPHAARWNFEFSVNTDWDGSSGLNIADLTYLLELDTDPTANIQFTSFDPITPGPVPFYDHAIGTNTTPNGGGTVAVDATQYATLIANNNLVQNSWNYLFFDGLLSPVFDPTVAGEYTIRLTAFDGGTPVAGTSMNVITTPEPSTYALMGGLMGLVMLIGYKKRAKAQQ